MKILVINGPNINMLGIREPGIYGSQNFATLLELLQDWAKTYRVDLEQYQSNHEGDLVDKIQAAFGCIDGIVINPAAYTHTSSALLDAIRAVSLPAVEVHLSDISTREEFRRISYIRPACISSILGHGTDGYLEAIDRLLEHLGGKAQ